MFVVINQLHYAPEFLVFRDVEAALLGQDLNVLHVVVVLNTDGILCELFATMSDQVSTVDSVDELGFSLESLHGPGKPGLSGVVDRLWYTWAGLDSITWKEANLFCRQDFALPPWTMKVCAY